jgi:hypothetical protein
MWKLKTAPIDPAECRTHLGNFVYTLSAIPMSIPEDAQPTDASHKKLDRLAEIMEESHRNPRSGVLLIMGAHILKAGLIRYVADIVAKGWGIDYVIVNGAFLVHEFELAAKGVTSEDVSKTLPTGMFGMRTETIALNAMEYRDDWTLGYSYQMFMQEIYPYSSWMQYAEDAFLSMQCAQNSVPFGVATIMGGDINHMYPNFDAAAWGKALHNDFIQLVEFLQGLDEVVLICAGSATIGPEIFQKALSVARNTTGGPKICKTAVLDLVDLPEDVEGTPPQEGTPLYYYRPWKTLLTRAVTGEGSESMYIQGKFEGLIPCLYARLPWHFSK